ncbi:MAG: MotA/TolQ/ExbB proton channel family protein [Rhodomicrobium sp.]
MEPAILPGQAGNIHILDLIKNASPVVQAVMGVLALASIVSWGIVIEKVIQLTAFGRQIRQLERTAFAPSEAQDAKAWLTGEILREAGRAALFPQETRSEQEARLERMMRLAARARVHWLQQRVRFLATVGSTAPFVGLFGTVWGIMTSFTAIAQQKDTSLAVVAPGIAEALFATALGLLAAIPAVVAYNQISGSISRAMERVNLAIAALAGGLAQRAFSPRNEA